MRVTISLACLLSCLSMQSALGQDLNRLRLLDYGEEQRPSRIRYEFIDTLHPLNFGRTIEYNQPPELNFGKMEETVASSQPYTPWLTTNWVAFGDKLDDSIQNCSSQTEAVPEEEEEVANERLLKQKLAERDKLTEEIERLQKLTGRPEQLMVHVMILEASPEVMKELGLHRETSEASQAADGEENPAGKDVRLGEKIEKARLNKRLKILAEPLLIATTGRPATLVNGGEFPLFLPKPDEKVGIEWREYGTRLEVVARNLGKGRLRLEISTEFSQIDTANSVTVAGKEVQGVRSRKSNSELNVQVGKTVALGGMISSGKDGAVELVTLVRCDLVDGEKDKAAVD